MLLQHGFSRSGRFWYNWVPLLSSQFRVLRPDMRGMGESIISEEQFEPSLDIFVDDLKSILDHLGIEDVVYVGESFGGILGLNFAHRYPERTRALVLCNTPCRLPSRDRSGRGGDTDDAPEPERGRLVHRHHQQPAGHPRGFAGTGRVVHFRDGPNARLHRTKTPGIPGHAGFQPPPEGGRDPDAPLGGRGIAHLDPGAAAVHGRTVAGLPPGGLPRAGPRHKRHPPGVVHPTGTGVSDLS